MFNMFEMLKKGEIQEAVIDAVNTSSAFDNLLTVDERHVLIEQGNVCSFSPGDILCRQNQVDSHVYIIIMGEVEVSEDIDGENLVLAYLGRGEIFGEISAFFNMPRVSTVRVSKPSVLLEIPGSLLEDLSVDHTELRDAVIKRYRERITDTAFRSVDLFRYLPSEILSELQDQSSILSLPKGSEIVKEGEPGDALYVIVHGKVQVSRNENNESAKLAILESGEYFGEWSLLTGAPRGATVLALTSAVLIRVDCQPFLAFIQRNPGVRERIDLVAHNRNVQRMSHNNSTNEAEICV